VLLLRQAHERAAELALLRALGFAPRHLRWLLLGEHWALTLVGLAIGLGAGAVAVMPVLRHRFLDLPWVELSPTLLLLPLAGLLATWLAQRWAWRAPPVAALRAE